MELDEIRACIERSAFWVTDHAITEGFKEGISVSDMMHVVQTGKVIERYPDRCRCVVLGQKGNGLPVHVVLDWTLQVAVEIVTTYVPQKDRWIRSQIRQTRERKRRR